MCSVWCASFHLHTVHMCSSEWSLNHDHQLLLEVHPLYLRTCVRITQQFLDFLVKNDSLVGEVKEGAWL